jgi:hypothetical protein
MAKPGPPMTLGKMRELAAALFALVAVFITTQTHATDSYTALSRAVVLAAVSPDLVDTAKIDPRPFAKCFRAQGLTANDLKATIKAGSPGQRVKRCLDNLIGL